MTNSNKREWQITIDFKTVEPMDEDAPFDLMEEYGEYGASAALDPDAKGGSLTLTIESGNGFDALSTALVMMSESESVSGVEPVSFEVTDWSEVKKRNREPLYPKVVGYAEIARMTGVSRQRAYKFPEIDTFPKPVIETSQGPLYSESAVAAWAATRETKAGRPRMEA